MIFTKMWLNNNIPRSAIELEVQSVFKADRTAGDSGKVKEKVEVCAFMLTSHGVWTLKLLKVMAQFIKII